MYSLSDKAMLASLSIHQWSAKKHDKKVSNEVAATHGMKDSSLGRYNKSLVAKKALEKISKLAGKARTDFYFYSLPWRDDGARILTSTAYFDLKSTVRKLNAEWDAAIDEFIASYPSLIEQAKIDLNGLFNPADYPSVSEIKTKFRFAFHVFPLGQAEDFRVKMADDERAIIQKQIEATMQATVTQAMKDVWHRMQDVISHMADRLKAYKVTAEGVENSFKDSLVNNMRELLEVIPALNLTDDPNVSKFANQMEALCTYDAQTLRDNDTKRELVQKAAEDILAKMEQFI